MNIRETQRPSYRVLLDVISELSIARDVHEVRAAVLRAARRIAGADGATFVVRDGDRCSYTDEDAIAPLWKGRRFDMDACISGWAMLQRQHAVIPDITKDERIPQDAYLPTFVRSLVMVPIRSADPIGALGVYWADHHDATDDEVELLRALADAAASAFERSLVRPSSVERPPRSSRGHTDAATGVYGRHGFLQHAARYRALLADLGRPATVVYCSLQTMPGGDVAVAADVLTAVFATGDVVARWADDAFVVLAAGSIDQTMPRLRSTIAGRGTPLAVGAEQLEPADRRPLEGVVTAARHAAASPAPS